MEISIDGVVACIKEHNQIILNKQILLLKDEATSKKCTCQILCLFTYTKS